MTKEQAREAHRIARARFDRNHRKLYKLVEEYDISYGVVDALNSQHYTLAEDKIDLSTVDLEVVEGDNKASKKIIKAMDRCIAGMFEANIQIDKATLAYYGRA